MQSFSQLLGQVSTGVSAQFLPIGGNPDPGGTGSGGDTGGGGITFGGGFAPISNPGGDGGGGGGGGGITFGIPGFPSGGGSKGTSPTTSTTPASWFSNLLPFLTGTGCGIGDFFLRIAFFILGFICIIGAIYLYKGSNPILQIPQKVLRGGTKALAMAAAE